MSADQHLETPFPSAVPVAETQPSSLLAVGASIVAGRYEVVRQLPSSALSEVYKVTDEHSPDLGAAAIKIFHEPDVASVRRVDREIDAHIALDGEEGIVSLRDVGVIKVGGKEYRYIATPFAEDGTLSALFERTDGGSNNLDLVRGMALQILPALGAMHRRGIIHRDVKPSNILVSGGEPEGSKRRYDLTDFTQAVPNQSAGLGAAALGATEASTDYGGGGTEILTERMSGTRGFVAPEIFDDQAPIGPKVDVFAVAVMIVQGLTGELPFAASSLEEYKINVTRESPALISSLEELEPVSLRKLAREALSIDPNDRPDTDEFAARLQAV